MADKKRTGTKRTAGSDKGSQTARVRPTPAAAAPRLHAGGQPENERLKSEENLKRAERIAGFGNWEWNILTNEVRWSDGVYRLYGMDPRQGKPSYEVVVQTLAPECRDRFSKDIENALERNVPFEGEYRMIGLDGTVRHTHTVGEVVRDAAGRPISMFGVVQDITDRRRMEEAFAESERRMRTVLDNVGAAIFIKDTRYRYTYANKKTCEILGKRPEDVVGKGDDAFFTAASVEEIVRSDRPVIERGEVVAREEADLTAPEGTPRTYWTVKLPLRDAAGAIEGLCGISTDITGRKRAEEALRESENRTRSIIESIPVGMHRYRMEPDGRLVFTGANQAADRILGVDNRMFVGKTIEEAFPPLAATEVPRRYREVVETGRPWQTESIEYKDNVIAGAFEVHAFRTGPDTMVAAFEVITERKRAELALKESEAKYRRLYNQTPVMMHSIDRNGVLIDVNDHWLKVMGYERNEVIGRKVTEFYTEASAKYAREVAQPEFFRTGMVKEIAFQFVKKDGEIIDVLLSATGERDAEGQVVRSQAVIEEITERKRVETALQESQRFLETIIESAPT